MRFHTNSSTTANERMRIDSSGRLLVGQTANYPATGGGTTKGVFAANADSRTDLIVSNQTNGANSGAALVLGSYGQDYVIESQSYAQGAALTFNKGAAERMRIDTSGNVLINSTSNVANEKLLVNGAQVVGTGAAGLYTVAISQSFAASAAKYLRIIVNSNLFGALTITATGDYSSVNAIGVFQKTYSVGINSSNTGIYSADNNTTLDMGGTSGQFSMGTPSKPNATTYYVPLANTNSSYPIAMALVIEMRGYIEGIVSVDIIAQ